MCYGWGVLLYAGQGDVRVCVCVVLYSSGMLLMSSHTGGRLQLDRYLHGFQSHPTIYSSSSFNKVSYQSDQSHVFSLSRKKYLRPITSSHRMRVSSYVQQYDYHDLGLHSHVEGTLEVDPHISAAPVFFDVENGGGKRMIVPVSYFFTSGRR